MNCPFCGAERANLFMTAAHIQRMHPIECSTVRLFVEPPVEAIKLQVYECDIDAIYAKRPDLVRPRGAA